MDPETAFNIAQNSASVLCLDVPEGFQFGVDMHSWTVGPKFKGVKMIPPGIHYIHYGTSGKAGAGTMSFFAKLTAKQVLVRRFNPTTEDFFLESEMDEEEVHRLEEGVRRFEFDAGLGAYPQDEYEKWLSLTHFVSEDVLLTLSTPTKIISSAAGAAADDEAELMKKLNINNSERTASETIIEGTEGRLTDAKKNEKLAYTLQQDYLPRFTHIPRRVTAKGATPSQITRYNLDKSAVLKQILEERYKTDYNGLVGELQFAFIVFLMGNSYEGFRQWKELIILITGCDEAIHTLPEFFCNFIDALYYQMKLMPDDFFLDALSGDNFLKTVLKGFFENLDENESWNFGGSKQAREKTEQFKILIEDRFKISFSVDELEEGDDAPVVVDY